LQDLVTRPNNLPHNVVAYEDFLSVAITSRADRANGAGVAAHIEVATSATPCDTFGHSWRHTGTGKWSAQCRLGD